MVHGKSIKSLLNYVFLICDGCLQEKVGRYKKKESLISYLKGDENKIVILLVLGSYTVQLQMYKCCLLYTSRCV